MNPREQMINLIRAEGSDDNVREDGKGAEHADNQRPRANSVRFLGNWSAAAVFQTEQVTSGFDEDESKDAGCAE